MSQKWVERVGFKLDIIVGGTWRYRCLTCGVLIDDDSTGQWSDLHAAWHGPPMTKPPTRTNGAGASCRQ